ncbi:DUF7736 domain-containing protein [Kineosporia babensis]|uniref:DUF7736 domain-containing protein n=1 Tax=Kineosporia babensis TaxID=499548 RepID=A0A9X1NBS7_9ACTN|nr:hypothetical protein [Kineosporia babensis]MCD5310934.1 hypothetical protein [Kineosporia babensis]
MSARDFHVGDLISVHSGRLVSPRHVDGLYDLLGWMTGDNLMTHQLPSASRIAQPYLEDQHPWLKDVTVPDWINSQATLEKWLSEIVPVLGEMHAVEQMPAMAWGVHDPIEDLRAIRPDLPIVTIGR